MISGSESQNSRCSTWGENQTSSVSQEISRENSKKRKLDAGSLSHDASWSKRVKRNLSAKRMNPRGSALAHNFNDLGTLDFMNTMKDDEVACTYFLV